MLFTFLYKFFLPHIVAYVIHNRFSHDNDYEDNNN